MSEVEERALRVMEKLGLSQYKDECSHHLSYGEKRRAALACVLAMDPR